MLLFSISPMAIDPEVIPPSSSAGHKPHRSLPKWFVFVSFGIGVLILVSFLKTFLPLIGMLLLLLFIYKQAFKD